MFRFVLAAVAAVFMSSAVNAAEFKVGVYNSGEAYIYMYGSIEEGDMEKLREAYLDSRIAGTGFQIQLNSPGGQRDESIKMAEWLRSKGAHTVVHVDQKCMSGCAIMWAHGSTRYISKSAEGVGFHMAYMPITPESVEWLDAYKSGFGWSAVQEYFKEAHREDVDFYSDMPVDRPLTFAAMIALYGAQPYDFWMIEEFNADIIGNVVFF